MNTRILLIIAGITVVAYFVYKALNNPAKIEEPKKNYTQDELDVRHRVTKDIFIKQRCQYTRQWLQSGLNNGLKLDNQQKTWIQSTFFKDHPNDPRKTTSTNSASSLGLTLTQAMNSQQPDSTKDWVLTPDEANEAIESIVKGIGIQSRKKLEYELATIENLVEIGVDSKSWPNLQDLKFQGKQFGYVFVPKLNTSV